MREQDEHPAFFRIDTVVVNLFMSLRAPDPMQVLTDDAPRSDADTRRMRKVLSRRAMDTDHWTVHLGIRLRQDRGIPRRCDSGGVDIKFHACPLKKAWQEAHAGSERCFSSRSRVDSYSCSCRSHRSWRCRR